MISGLTPIVRRRSGPRKRIPVSNAAVMSASQIPCHITLRARTKSRAPTACEISGSTPNIKPSPKTETPKKTALPKPTAASSSPPKRPTTAMSTTLMTCVPASATASGSASENSRRNSAFSSAARIVAECYCSRPSPGLRPPSPEGEGCEVVRAFSLGRRCREAADEGR